MKKLFTVVAVLVIAAGGWFGYSHRVGIADRLFHRTEDVPAAVNRDDIVNRNTDITVNDNVNAPVNTNTEQPLPAELNLKVPFTSQAPDANWDHEHEEFCEEAAVLMTARYWQGRAIRDKADAEQALQQIKDWEMTTFGFFEDTNARETVRILREFYEFPDVVIIDNPTLTDIKREIAAGRPVIVPTAGRELHNPNFKSPGPLYHMLVVKGYTKDGKLITNDAGTRKGADYVYDADVLMNAIHDWNAGDVVHGGKVMIVVRGTDA